jgi:hypothetical protein
MRSTEQTQQDSAKTYKNLLLEAKDLRQRSGDNAYRRITLLVKVYQDPDFRSDHHMFDDDKLLSILDEYVDDLCATFYELKLILDHFPKKEQWADGKLYQMLQKVLDANAAKNRASKTEGAQPTTPKKREDPYAVARREKARMSAIIDELMERIKQLEAENDHLRNLISKGTRSKKASSPILSH